MIWAVPMTHTLPPAGIGTKCFSAATLQIGDPLAEPAMLITGL